jgi:hypothetical protein
MKVKRSHQALGSVIRFSALVATGTAVFFASSMLQARAPRRGAAEVLRTPSPSSGAETASLFSPEKGKFRIRVNGQDAGTEEFEIGRSGSDWVAHGTSEIQTPQGVAHVTGTLTLQPDGTPSRYEWSTKGVNKSSAAIVFSGTTATVELNMEGARPFTQQFTFSSPRIAILDNNLYHQYSVLARLYDWGKKGAQTFSVLVPQEMTPGTVTVESLGKQDFGGTALEELSVKTEDIELDLYLDGQRLVRIVAPSSNAEVTRE